MLVFLNPHKNHLYGKVRQRINSGESNVPKLNYFLQAFLKINNSKYLIDKQRFPEYRFNLLELFYLIFFSRRQLKQWEKLNDIKINKSMISWREVSYEDTIVLNAKDLKYKNISKFLKKTKAKKILLLTNHFCHHPDLGKDVLSNFKGEIELLSELPVRSKPIYKDYLPNKNSEIIMGYTIADRFFYKKKFFERKKKAIVIGSYSLNRKRNQIEQSYFNNNKLNGSQHYRYMIDKNIRSKSKVIDNFTSERSRSNVSKKDFITKVSRYYSTDLNEKLNSYMLLICPPDSYDVLPQLMFEAMACGTVVITNIDPTLEELNIYEGQHYVGFDFKNNINQLEKFVEDLLNNEAEKLKTIHDNVIKLSKNFRVDQVIKNTVNFLEKYN